MGSEHKGEEQPFHLQAHSAAEGDGGRGPEGGGHFSSSDLRHERKAKVSAGGSPGVTPWEKNEVPHRNRPS